MDQIPRLSEAVYVGLCREVGSPTEVRIRREVMDTVEVLRKPVSIKRGYERMVSGSKREGFRMRTSDEDFMAWISNHKVICDISQTSLYRIPQDNIILMECDDLPPGFTRLILMRPSNYPKIISLSVVFMNGKVYISSKLFSKSFHQDFKSTHSGASSFQHGPCSTIIDLGYEKDLAFCLWSQHWPTKALPWIQRCRQQGWPSDRVILEILNGGFHVVPIGSTTENELEWRISFSRAEQKLVYSMNHCQFLCYGLFKLFLKEVINFQNNSPVLCSYFIKTIVFWVVQNTICLTWTPHSLLSCYWKCLKLLVNWVRIGEGPNIFIPQNNMFQRKVFGSVQISLFRQLYDLYCKGISCLLLSPTLRPYLSKALLYRSIRICTDESSILFSTDLDISFYRELSTYAFIPIRCIEEFRVYMEYVKRILIRNLSPYEIATVQCMTSGVLGTTAFLIQTSIDPNKYCNKIQYKANKVIDSLIKLSCTFGYVSDILYLAMYLYRNCRYEHSLNCLQQARERMSQPYIMYYEYVNLNMYGQYMSGIPLGKKMRRTILINIELRSDYINELVMEQKINDTHGRSSLYIPPLVMLHMLLILNHHRLGDTVRSQQSLQDLQTLMLYDDRVNVPISFRDISWQILGICQQITGNNSGSLQSYQYSLQQYPFHNIQKATQIRINSLSHGMI